MIKYTVNIQPVSYTHLDVYKRQARREMGSVFIHQHLLESSSMPSYHHRKLICVCYPETIQQHKQIIMSDTTNVDKIIDALMISYFSFQRSAMLPSAAWRKFPLSSADRPPRNNPSGNRIFLSSHRPWQIRQHHISSHLRSSEPSSFPGSPDRHTWSLLRLSLIHI